MKKRSNKLMLLLAIILIVFSVGVISLAERGTTTSTELDSPSDWIKENQIKVYNDKVVLDINKASWAKFTDTNSMDPFLDEKSHAIEIMPENPEDVNVGDIISYTTKQGIIIHRVIDTGFDEKGFFYVVKGDNNKQVDLYQVRFENIKGVVVAVIY
jgi:signal peptidase I